MDATRSSKVHPDTSPRNFSELEEGRKSADVPRDHSGLRSGNFPEKVAGRKSADMRRTQEALLAAGPEERLEMVREMPVPMNVKRSIREGLPKVNESKQNSCCFGCRQRWMQFKQSWSEFWRDAELMRGSLKTIEGHFGSSVASYFRFLRWLIGLNGLIFFFTFIFISLPEIIFNTPVTDNSTLSSENATLCTEYIVNISDSVADRVIDFFQGTGWMEQRLLFYGNYSQYSLVISTFGGRVHTYNLPLAYVVIIIVVCVVSLILMVRHTSKGFRAYTRQNSSKRQDVFCALVLTSWDFGLTNPKTCKLKYASLKTEILSLLVENEQNKKHQARSCRDKCQLYTARFFINLIVIAILGGSGYLIFYTTNESLQFSLRDDYSDQDAFVRLLMEFLPSITISALNFVVPIIFEKLVKGEGYKPETELQWTLVRTVFLRLASVAVLVGTLYYEITCSTCVEMQCWETYVGQQMYKLILMDFLLVLAVVFLVDFPRRLIVTKCSCRLGRLVGQAEFALPKSVLDLVYTQTICWLGAVFSPLVPGIVFFSSIIIFYVRKVTCICNFMPAARPFRAARARSFFMAVLITAFMLCCVPIGFIIWKMTPSCRCGPFRGQSAMLDVFSLTVDTWPAGLQAVIDFMTSAGFVVPLFVLLVLLVYFCSSVADAHKDTAAMFQNQLKTEALEKQALKAKLSA